MAIIGHTGRQRLLTVGLLSVPLALAGWVGAGIATGSATAAPTMSVTPSTGLKYSQTVDVKGHNLPKGSGSTAATICGLQDAAGKTIASPTADDCAGANEIGKLVIVKSWTNGEFDTQYTLPASGQKFGTNNRFCDKTHLCAVVVADANPSAPAYHVQTTIHFADQVPTTTTTKPKSTPTTAKPTTPTTKPASGTTPPSTGTTQPPATGTTQPPATGNGNGNGKVTGNVSASVPPSTPTTTANNGVNANVGVTIQLPGATTPTVPSLTVPSASIPAPVAAGLTQVCTQLSSVVKQAGGDPSLLVTACNSLAAGTGPQELALVLQSPSLLCIEGASAWQNNAQITAACTQAATALAPVTAPLASALAPLLANI
jgi:hypothetical protein